METQDMRNNIYKVYKALTDKDEKVVKDLCKEDSEGPFRALTSRRDSVLQKALYSGQVNLVLELLADAKERWPREFDKKLGQVNLRNDTILHVAATHDTCLRAAIKIFEFAPQLLTSVNNDGETPIFLAARYGQLNMFKFLNGEIAKQVPDEEDRLGSYKISTKSGEYTILHVAIYNEHFELALYIAKTLRTLISEKNHMGMTGLHNLAMIPSAFRTRDCKWLKHLLPSPTLRISNHTPDDQDVETAVGLGFSITIPWWERTKKEYLRYEAALQLAKLLITEDTDWIDPLCSPDTVHNNEDTDPVSRETAAATHTDPDGPGKKNVKPPTPLILATKFGSLEIVREIIKQHPHTVEQVDPKYGSILHLAIKYRKLEIVDLVEKMEMQMRKLVRLKDEDQNSILHMVALNITKATDLKKNSTDAASTDKTTAKGPWDAEDLADEARSPGFELRDDLLLFERIEEILKTHYHKTFNKDYLTADQLFEANKQKLKDDAQEWMKRTAENCSIVAVLIATVAFAAAYTVPGGSNPDGSPVLLKETFFIVFTISDVLSLASTLSAVVIFLSILSSSFRFVDFRDSLPKSLMFGISCLIFSLAMMMLAFAATVILMIKNRQQWTRVALYAVAFLPVTALVATYLPFYKPLGLTLGYTVNKLKSVLPRIHFRGVRKFKVIKLTARPRTSSDHSTRV